MPTLPRKALLAATILLLAAMGTVVYMSRIEPDWLKSTGYDIARKEPALVIAHLTDFHVEDQRDLDRVRRAVALVRERKPDLIAVTGDFFTRSLVLREPYREVLAELADIAPAWAVAGNHDGGIWARERGGPENTAALADLLEGTGIRLLENTLDSLVLRGRRILIHGAGDPWAGMCQPIAPGGFGTDTTATRILLVHNPDARHLFQGAPWDLLLSGHTHGGQISLPVVGTPFAPVKDRRCVRGLRMEDGRAVVVSSGVGNLHGLRFNVRPEVVTIRF